LLEHSSVFKAHPVKFLSRLASWKKESVAQCDVVCLIQSIIVTPHQFQSRPFWIHRISHQFGCTDHGKMNHALQQIMLTAPLFPKFHVHAG
jgi:hypothetical protein